ncbi:MAG: hypothetical protein LBS36_08170 [Oscillospiraceae bacterium]|jgi:hypothetical protein|nr:hypothetical protein [Oscillospiraceae bacterium]
MMDKLTAYYKQATAALLSFLLLFATTMFGAGPAAQDPIVATQVDYAFDTDRILIGGYGYTLEFADDEHLGYVRDAGIDFLVSGATESFLNACEQNGIGVIAKSYGGLPTYGWTNIDTTPNSPWLTLTPETFQDHPALWGNDLMDEPSVSSFETLAAMMDSYRGKTNGKLAYVNLYPSYANEEQLGTTADWFAFSKEYQRINSYQKHVNAYIETIDSDYISVDIYPLKERADPIGGGSYKYTELTWLKNLDILAEACRKTGRDLWVITQATGEVYEGSSVTRVASENDIRWQAYTSLAFGAKAIIHACYQNGWWDASSHLVTPAGERTPTYYAAQAVNQEIKAISDIYMDYDNVGAFVHNAYKEQHTRIALSKTDFSAVSGLKSDDTLLVGCFDAKEGGGKALMMVNMTEISSGKTTQASFKLDGASAVTAYVGGEPQTLTPDASGNYTLSLLPGEGVFVTAVY